MKRGLLISVVLVAVAACGGGGGSSAVPLPGSGAPVPNQSAREAVRVAFPGANGGSTSRRPAFLSASTASFTLQVYTVNGSTPNPQPTPLSIQLSNTQYCTASESGTTCTVNFPVPVATAVVIQIETFDANGNVLASGTIGPVNTTLATIPAQSVSVGGVLAAISLSAAALSAADDGTTHTISFTVSGKDADGNTILPPGNYSSPIALTIANDPNAALSVAPATITAPPPDGATTVTLTYASATTLSSTATITASAGGATSASLTFAPITFNPRSLPGLLVGGGSGSVSVSEPGYSQAFNVGGIASVATVSCVPANCTPTTAGGTVVVNVLPFGAGSGNVTIGDALGGSATVGVTVTASGGTIPIAGAPTIYKYTTATNGTNYGITVGPDGQTLWFVDRANATLAAVPNPSACNATSCAIDEIPNPQPTTPAGLQAIASGSDGNLYYTGTSVGGDSGATFQATCTSVPSVSCTNANFYSYASGAQDVVSAPDGNLYVTSGFGSYGYLYESPVASCCSFTDELSISGGLLNAMALDPSGTTMWFTDTGTGDVGYFSLPCSYCEVTEQPSGNLYGGGARRRGPPGTVQAAKPSRRRNLCCGNPFATPLNGIIAGPDGNLYVAEAGASEIDQLSPTVWEQCSGVTCTYTSIALTIEPSGSTNASAAPQNFAVGPDGNVWFTDGDGYIGFISISSCATACRAYEYSVGGAPWGITLGPDGNIWFTDSSTNKIGKVVLQ